MFWRLCAIGCIAGGALRILDAFPVVTGSARMQGIVYPLTDLLLLLGLCGLYLPLRKTLGLAGALGFGAAVVGLLIVRSAAFNGLGANSYLIGATVTLIGVVTLSVILLVRGVFPKLAPGLWIGSFVVGLLGLLFSRPNLGMTLAGIVFGLGFVVAGVNLLGQLPFASQNGRGTS